jgi:hypothetical protein
VRWEYLAALLPVLAAVTIAVVALRKPSSTSAAPSVGKPTTTSVVLGQPIAEDEVSDDGAGSVTVSAKLNRAATSPATARFTLYLNTHSVDQSAFDPTAAVTLRPADGRAIPAWVVSDPSGQSSHHRSFELEFANPGTGPATLVVRDVAGIPERDLPFTL